MSAQGAKNEKPIIKKPKIDKFENYALDEINFALETHY